MGELIYEIHPDLCTECVGHHDQPQCQLFCPVDCIPLDPNHVLFVALAVLTTMTPTAESIFNLTFGRIPPLLPLSQSRLSMVQTS